MKKTFLRDMLGILCTIAGFAILGGVEVTVSSTLLLLAPAALLLLGAAYLLAAKPPVRRRPAHRPAPAARRENLRRAA